MNTPTTAMKNKKNSSKALLTIGSIFLIVSAYLFYQQLIFTVSSKSAHGVIMAYQERDPILKNIRRSSKEGAIVEFTTELDSKIIFSPSRFSTLFIPIRIGNKVEIIYSLNQPRNATVNTFWGLWGMAFLIFNSGLCVLWFSAKDVKKYKKLK